jgi:uncharacterized protein
VVLMVPTTQPEDIASYANRVANAWKIGRKAVGDGVLVIVAKDDRKVRIEVAKTLEGAVPDLAAQIIDDAMKPRFRQRLRRRAERGGRPAHRAHLGEALPEPSRAPRRRALRRLRASTGSRARDLPVLRGADRRPMLRGVLGRKLGALVTGGGVGAIAMLITRACWWPASPACALLFSLLSARRRHAAAARRAGFLPGGFGGGGGGGGGAAAAAAAASAPAAAAISGAAAPRGTGEHDAGRLRVASAPPLARRVRHAPRAAAERARSGCSAAWPPASGATAARSASASRRAAHELPVADAHGARAGGRCSASCASGTPSTTTAC